VSWTRVTRQFQQLFRQLSVVEVANRFVVSRQRIHSWLQISVGRDKAGLDVYVLVSDSETHVYHKGELLKTALRSNGKEVRKLNVSVLKKIS
jgi:molybdopterin biosynthesis enzyme MoaB